MRVIIYTFVALFIYSNGISQTEPVIFTVADQPVYQSEFDYIYNKNNAEKATYSKESLDEYLDLYIKFKLKVAKARAMKLDTVSSLNSELDGYRNQLAKSYMVDKDVTNALVDEAFERKKKDIRVSHILVSIDKHVAKEVERGAFEKITKMKMKLRNADDFKVMAKTLSDDRSSSLGEGDLGWMTALLPDGFYEFENAIYTLKPGEISDPVRSKLGYHLLMVTDERVARGEMEVSHLLIRARMKGQEVKGSKAKADSLYQLLQGGASFDMLASQNSDDKNTATKGGYLGFFGISQFDKKFEDAAFELKKDGEYTKPVRTSIGWHIILRKSKKDYSSPDKLRKDLEERITQNDRYELAKSARLVQIRDEGSFAENLKIYEQLESKLLPSFYSYKWEVPKLDDGVLFSFEGDQKYMLSDFAAYCKKNIRKRLRMNKDQALGSALKSMYKDYKDDRTITFEEANLERKYPEFKSLMQEYSEGILLFEATKINVWEKASKDSTALQNFYEKNKKLYYWKPRGKLGTYTFIEDNNTKEINNLVKDLRKKTSNEIIEKYKNVKYISSLHEVGSESFLGLNWKVSDIAQGKDKKTGMAQVKILEDILPESQKTFKECRGYVIADYQDEVEKNWIKDLRKDFPVKINQEVLDKMVRN